MPFSTRALGQVCRRAKRRWGKDQLQALNEILRDNLSIEYFSDLIEKNFHNPKALFSIINADVKSSDKTL